MIIGAGPIGLEAALYGALLGYEVGVLEAGRVGGNVLSWGHISMFSPWEMNCSSLGLRTLAREGVRPWRDPGAVPTGREYVARYLLPLSASLRLRGIIRQGTRVVAISRNLTAKEDLPGAAARAHRPFRLLVERAGREEIHEADIVMDASGTLGQPRALGNGGIPAPGENRAARRIDRGIPDFGTSRVAARFAGRRILLVGAGHSAATSALGLSALAARHRGTRILWAFRGTRRPLYARVPGDALARRDALCAGANRLAAGADPRIEALPGTVVDSIAPERRRSDGRLEVTLRAGGHLRRVSVDRIVANVGSTPDVSILSELQVHLCYATYGPIKLAAVLLGEGSGDCLAQAAPSGDLLSHPEPGFYILGSKSYGRNSAFLIRNGLEQIRSVFAALAPDARIGLDGDPPAPVSREGGAAASTLGSKRRAPAPEARA
jgi:hypothetical protein